MDEISRKSLISDSGARKLLQNLLQTKAELMPEYDSNVGFRYPLAEQYIVGSVQEIQHILRRLFEAGIFLKKYHDKAVACPSCFSPTLSITYLCPFCTSSHIGRENESSSHTTTSLIAGPVFDIVPVFNVLNKQMAAEPKRSLNQKAQSSQSRFTCKQCGQIFDRPTWMHYCTRCKLDFTINEASFIDVYSYVLAEKAKAELEFGPLSILPVKQAFQKSGFKTWTPGTIKGKSGNAHSFDLVAARKTIDQEITFVLDLADSRDENETSSLALIGKMIDVDVQLGILVAVPSVNPQERKLLSLSSITLVEAESTVAAAEIVDGQLREMV